VERNEALKAEAYERTEQRKGYANGFKSRTIQTRVGKLKVNIPQVRGTSFYPQALEKGTRTEIALNLAVAEMYLNGVSTRKVEAITKELCGFDISSTQVSRCSKLLDEKLETFRSRPLSDKYAYVYLDATYEKVRNGGSVVSMATLVALGINEEGQREILGISSKLSEAKVHWKSFLESLQERGLSGTQLIISDDHAGLKAARKEVFPGIKWQRCQFHMAQNAQQYAPKKTMQEELGEALRKILHSTDYETAKEQVKKVIQQYSEKAPAFVNWLEENIEEGLTCFSFPEKHRKQIRTSNMIERLNREIKRRTQVVTVFCSVASCERLVTAVLESQHNDWAGLAHQKSS